MKRSTIPVLLMTTLTAGALALAGPSGPASGAATTQTAAPATAKAGSLRHQLGLSKDERLVRKDVLRDADGSVHLRFDRLYRGLPVIGGDLVVHRDPAGSIGSVTWATTADLSALGSVRPSVSPAAAASIAARDTGLVSVARDSQLVVYAVGPEARLAWGATAEGIRSDGPASDIVYVDAVSGVKIAGWSLNEQSTGTGKTLYSGKVKITTTKKNSTFLLWDKSRGGHKILNATGTHTGDPQKGKLFKDKDDVWGNGKPSQVQSAAADVAYGTRLTWDYYKHTFHRLGTRDDGVAPRSYVHYGDHFENAFWSDDCFCMTYGDGATTFRQLVATDVIGHEITHGITSNTAALIYSGESGGLNEATSDIFGTMIEFSANDKQDRGDYLIGENIVKPKPHFLRRMDRPAADAPLYNGGFHSYNCWTKSMGIDDVHLTSGVANHFFYLLAEGSGKKTIGGTRHNSPTCNGTKLPGIGRAKSAAIWYRALTHYMVSTTGYREARDATIQAARDLYGPGTTACAQVERSWRAVAVPLGQWTCAGGPPARGANVVLDHSFETGAPWVATAGVITSFSNQNFFPHTGAFYAYLDGYGVTHVDNVQQSGIVVPAGSPKLRFWLFTASAGDADDTLEVQVGTGTPTTIATFTSDDNNSGTYVLETLDLTAFAGDTVTVNFLGTEDAADVTNFLIDDVSVTPH